MRLFHRNGKHERDAALEAEIATIGRIMAKSPGNRVPVLGAPSHCPTCGEWGMVDESSPASTSNHCYLCGAEWIVTARALAAVAAASRHLHAAPTGRGVLFGADLNHDTSRTSSRSKHPSNGVARVQVVGA